MLSWKKSCLTLAFAGVVSSSFLHSQLLAAGKEESKGRYGDQRRPSMNRIQNKLMDRYKNMIPDSEMPAQGPGAHERTAKSLTPTRSLPLEATPAVRSGTVIDTAIVGTPQSKKPVTVSPAPVMPMPENSFAPPSSLTVSLTKQEPLKAVMPAATTTTAVVTKPQPTVASAEVKAPIFPVQESRAATTVVTTPLPTSPIVTKSVTPAPVASVKPAQEPTEVWKKAMPAVVAVPVAKSKADTVEDITTAPMRMPHHRPASQPTVGQAPVRPRMVDNVASQLNKPAPVSLTTPKLAKSEPKPVAAPTRVETTKLVSPLPTNLAKSESAALPPVATVSGPKNEAKIPEWKNVETKTPDQPEVKEVVKPEITVAESKKSTSPDTTKRMLTNMPAPVVATAKVAKRPIVPLQTGTAPILKRTRELFKPGKKDYESLATKELHADEKEIVSTAPGKSSATTVVSTPATVPAVAKLPAPLPPNSKAPDAIPVTAAAPEPKAAMPSKVVVETKTPSKDIVPATKQAAGEGSYAARIASTYDHVVNEGKKPVKPMVNAPISRRSTIPGVPLTSFVPEKKETSEVAKVANISVPSASFPTVKGEKVAEPVTPMPAVAKAVAPETKLPSEPPAPISAGLSFVMERAKQGALLAETVEAPKAPVSSSLASQKTPEAFQKSAEPTAYANGLEPTKLPPALPPSPTVVVNSIPAPARIPEAKTLQVSKEPAVVTAAEPVVTTAKPTWATPSIAPKVPAPKASVIATTKQPAKITESVTRPASSPKLVSKENVASRIPSPAKKTHVEVASRPAIMKKVPATPPQPPASPDPIKVTTIPVASTMPNTVLPTKGEEKPTKVELAKLPSSVETNVANAVHEQTSPKSAPVSATPVVQLPATRSNTPTIGTKGTSPTTADVASIQKHLEVLRKPGNDQERQKALQAIATIGSWEEVKMVGPVLRNISMTDYNTHLRLKAVEMLGAMTTDRRMVVEALHISAEYDSDATIRTTAMRLLDQIAAAPSDTLRR